MKKLLIIIVLVLLLSGCNFLKNPILRTIGNEIDTCEDECQTDENLYASYLEEHKERIDELMKSFINNDDVEMMILRNDELVKKDDIVRHDYVTDNFDIPILYPINKVHQYMFELDIISKNCDAAGVCNENIDLAFRKSSDFKYGFDEFTGYYTYLINNNDIEYIKTVRFNINDEEIEYTAYLINNTDMSIVDFEIFQNGIFKSYHYVSDTACDFFYINQNTNDSLFFKQESENEFSINAYVSDTQRFYAKTADNNYRFKIYDNMHFVSSISNISDDYSVISSMFYFPDWDEIHTRINSLDLFHTAYNQNEEVYQDYDIYSNQMNMFFIDFYAMKQLSKEEVTEYDFPQGFLYDIDFSSFYNEFERWTQTEDCLSIFEITKSDLEKSLELQIAHLSKLYIE